MYIEMNMNKSHLIILYFDLDLFIIFMPLILGYTGKESNTKNITINYKRGNKKW